MAETGNRGVDVVFDNVGEAVLEASMNCTAYNGRYLMMGFASNKTVADEPFIVPRRLLSGNFKLCGVLFAYVTEGMAPLMKKGMGWNFVTNEPRPAHAWRDPRAGPERKGAAGDRAHGRLRGAARCDRGDGEPRDGRPHDRQALGGVTRRGSRRPDKIFAPVPLWAGTGSNSNDDPGGFPLRPRLLVSWLALGLILAVSGCASLGLGGGAADRIQRTGELRVGMAGDYPPMNARTADGRLIGLDADLAMALANILQVELVLVEKPFGDLIEAVRKKEVDVAISGISMTPPRNLDVAFAGPYYVARKAILGRPEALVGVSHISDLASRVLTVTALRGSTSQSLVERTLPRSAHRFVDSQDEAIALVVSGQADVMVADDPVIRFALLLNPGVNLDYVESSYSAEPIGIAIAPDDPLFVNLVENYLENLENLGLMDAWREKWFENPAWTKLLP